MIREAEWEDLHGLLVLYTQLHGNPLPEEDENLIMLWKKMMNDENHHIIVAEENKQIISSCVINIIPNLTHFQRPYALVENVVTDASFRKQGYASACLSYAKVIAEQNNCYKIMLLTGSKKESILSFYEHAGYNRNDKTAFIQWVFP